MAVSDPNAGTGTFDDPIDPTTGLPWGYVPPPPPSVNDVAPFDSGVYAVPPPPPSLKFGGGFADPNAGFDPTTNQLVQPATGIPLDSTLTPVSGATPVAPLPGATPETTTTTPGVTIPTPTDLAVPPPPSLPNTSAPADVAPPPPVASGPIPLTPAPPGPPAFVPPAPQDFSGFAPADFGLPAPAPAGISHGNLGQSGPHAPGGFQGFTPQIPSWARGLQRSPFAQFQQARAPFAQPFVGGFDQAVNPDELRRKQQMQSASEQALPAWMGA